MFGDTTSVKMFGNQVKYFMQNRSLRTKFYRCFLRLSDESQTNAHAEHLPLSGRRIYSRNKDILAMATQAL